ncbi:nucleotidyltransferase domain-containing protein [Halobacillus salinus]|uniref:nucleotidyltransferase domain-containing protein n=1 Tax=Halobacillus salinus TaxID=192814 RepID=UPI0009A636E7|nr:nucleotidyltransferase domain-containing protein [Halobacillus salinus]
MEKLEPLEAAKRLIAERFPDCQGALLAGSVVRGEATETSDLDIVIFDKNLPWSFRESLVESGWPVELFAHNLTSYKQFIAMDCESGTPTMPRMIAEGIVLKDEGILDSLKKESQTIVDRGPEEWSGEFIRTKRYFLTDALDDFLGSKSRAEDLFIANSLAELVQEFVLRTNCHWIGTSKWVVRELKRFDESFAEEFINAFDTFYVSGEKGKVVQLVDKVLAPYGGRLFDGFSIGKEEL